MGECPTGANVPRGTCSAVMTVMPDQDRFFKDKQRDELSLLTSDLARVVVNAIIATHHKYQAVLGTMRPF
jgi:hypothetical protein